MKLLPIISVIASFILSTTYAFAPSSTCQSQKVVNINTFSKQQLKFHDTVIESNQPVAFLKQRHSMTSIQTMSLFGLGGPEIAIILIVAAFVLGPQKLAELGKDAGKIAGELKEVPKEFQKGLQEGEAQAKALKEEMTSSQKTEE